MPAAFIADHIVQPLDHISRHILRQRRLGHVRAFGHDLRDVAGRIVGIGEAAKVRTALLVFQPS